MDKKNRMDTEFTKENDHEIKQEEYCFVKEVIKEKPLDIRGMVFRGIIILMGAVVFGVVAALVFVHILPMVNDTVSKDEKVVFQEEDSKLVYTPSPTELPNLQEGEGNSVNGTDAESNAEMMESYEELYWKMNEVAQDALHSIVTVTGIKDDEDWFRMDTQSVKQATGVIVANTNQEYYILTEYRSVEDVDRIMLTFQDGSMVDGRYQMHDTNTGLTVLTVDEEDIPDTCEEDIKAATFGNSYLVKQGQAVVAIGSPMGYSNSVVHGQVTSVSSTISAYDEQYNVFITDMLGSADGSGVVIDLNGNVIGVIAQSFSDEEHKNVITCLPISQLKSVISVLSNKGELPYLGIKGRNVTAEISRQTGIPKGVYVNEVHRDSPALQAGIQVADIITEVQGTAVENMYQYSEQLFKVTPGDLVDITIMRKGTEGYVEFKFQAAVTNR